MTSRSRRGRGFLWTCGGSPVNLTTLESRHQLPGEHKLRVLVADDHPFVRKGITSFIDRQHDWELCPEARSGREAVAIAEKYQPDIAVLDIHMPDLNGIDATRQIKKACPKCEVLILTGVDSDEIIRSAFEAGARSFLLKTDHPDQLDAALAALAEHKPYFTPHVSEVIFSSILMGKKKDMAGGKAGRLSSREREVIQLLAEGLANKEVAARLGISVKTVETHRAAIMTKLGLDSFSALVRYAVRNHIIEA
jgi:DNA-binding NarL/FixJ family response regulator